jgi:hypothetical protein
VDVHLEQVAYRWDCALAEAEMPREVVYHALLCFEHDLDRGVVAALREAMAPVAGPARVLRLPFRTTMSWNKPPYRLRARLRPGSIELRSANRLQAAALRRLVEALGTLPTATGLELHGEVPHYSKAFSGLRACSPCQARR